MCILQRAAGYMNHMSCNDTQCYIYFYIIIIYTVDAFLPCINHTIWNCIVGTFQTII